jgi:hypothetical protein
MYTAVNKTELDKKYDLYFEKVIDYARNNLGIEVKTNSKSFEYDAEEQILYCSSRLRGDIRYICYLLHELGHHNQPDSVFHSIPRKGKTKQICIILEQEYTAWKIGWEIALYLDINDLWSLYVKEWADAWTTYIKRLANSNSKDLKEISEAYFTSSIHPFTFKEY